MSINKMDNYPIFDSPTTVYKLNGFSLQELLSQFWKHINEVIEGTNLTREDMDNLIKETDERLNAQDKILSEFIEWVKNEALPPLVEEEILKMYEDGRLADLINVTIFGELNDKIDGNIVNTNKNTTDITNINSQLEQRTNYITLEKFGAKGDGVTDDTLAFQKAIDYARENKVSIKLGNKTYLTTSPLQLWDYISIEGNFINDEYQNGSILKNEVSNIFDIEYKTEISAYRSTGIKINGICFIGSNNTSFFQEKTTYLNWSQIKNCGFRNFKTLFHNIKMTGCWVNNIFFNKGIGVGSVGGSDNTFKDWFVSVNETIETRATMMFNFDNINYSFIENLFLTGSLTIGKGCKKIIRLNNSKNNVFSRIYIDYCDEEGLYIENASKNNTFVNCSFRGCSRGTTLKDYILLKSQSNDNTFMNCTFTTSHLEQDSNELSRFYDIQTDVDGTRLINNVYDINRRKLRSINYNTLIIENSGERYLNNNLEMERVGTFTQTFSTTNKTITQNSKLELNFNLSGLELTQVIYKSFVNIYYNTLPQGVLIYRTIANASGVIITLKNTTSEDIILNSDIKFDVFKMF